MNALTRRQLLWASAGSAAAFIAPPARADRGTAPTTRVFLRLRGGADGLNLIVPYTQPGYYEARPSIAIAAPSTEGGGADCAVDVGNGFGLHPCLGWKPLFQQKHLGVLLGVGLKSRIVSHRGAQQELDAAVLRAAGNPAFDALTGPLLQQLQRVADTLPAAEPRTFLLESSGWDTHLAQGTGARGRFAERARELGAGLLDFHTRARAHWASVRVAIVTEFGRTLSESAIRGTDDAYASILMTLGPEESGTVQGHYGTLAPGCACEERACPPSFDLEATLGRFARGEALLPA